MALKTITLTVEYEDNDEPLFTAGWLAFGIQTQLMHGVGNYHTEMRRHVKSVVPIQSNVLETIVYWAKQHIEDTEERIKTLQLPDDMEGIVNAGALIDALEIFITTVERADG